MTNYILHKKSVLIIIIIIFNLTVMAENNTMQFDKTKQGIRIQMLVNSSKGETSFETMMKIKEKEILIDKVVSNSPLFKDPNKYPFFNIFDFVVREKQLFIFYNDFGQIFMDAYMNYNDDIKEKRRYFIGKFGIISYENGGDINSVCSETWVNNNLYFHINAGQSYGGSLNELFVLKYDKVKTIYFTETKKLIVLKPVRIRESGKEWYEANKNVNTKSETDIEKRNLLSQFYNIPFSYYRMTPDNDIYAKENTYLWNNGLEEYKIIHGSISNIKELDIVQKEQITNYIHYILSQYTLVEINKIDLLGLISCKTFRKYDIFDEDDTKIKNFTTSFSGNMLYFFVLVNSSQLHIVRYNQSSNDWLIAGYTEKEIKPKE